MAAPSTQRTAARVPAPPVGRSLGAAGGSLAAAARASGAMAGSNASSFLACETLSLDIGECGGHGSCSGLPSQRPFADQTIGACICPTGWRGSVDFIERRDAQCDVHEPTVQVLWVLVMVFSVVVTGLVAAKMSFLAYVLSAREGPAFGFHLRTGRTSCARHCCDSRPGRSCPFGAVRLTARAPSKAPRETSLVALTLSPCSAADE